MPPEVTEALHVGKMIASTWQEGRRKLFTIYDGTVEATISLREAKALHEWLGRALNELAAAAHKECAGCSSPSFCQTNGCQIRPTLETRTDPATCNAALATGLGSTLRCGKPRGHDGMCRP